MDSGVGILHSARIGRSSLGYRAQGGHRTRVVDFRLFRHKASSADDLRIYQGDAASALWDKFLIARYDRLAVQAYTCYYQSLMMIAIVMTMWYPSRKRSTPFRWRWSIFLTAVLLTAADFLYFYALSDPQALLSVVSTIRRSGVVVTFVAGALMFRERQIGTKAALLAVVLSGVALLYFG